jgi:hypothetical protein
MADGASREFAAGVTGAPVSLRVTPCGLELTIMVLVSGISVLLVDVAAPVDDGRRRYSFELKVTQGEEVI